jgi:hypothetical protein
MYFLTIREGADSSDTYPILATADQEIIDLVVRGITRKLSTAPPAISVLKRRARKTEDNPDHSNDRNK